MANGKSRLHRSFSTGLEEIPMTNDIGGDLEISGHRICVVFDSRTGRVVHIHESIALEGTKLLADDALRARSLELAAGSANRDAKSRVRMETIVVAPEELPQDGHFRMNPKSRAFMPVKPARPRSKAKVKRKAKRTGARKS
jgi:hypothetical protein